MIEIIKKRKCNDKKSSLHFFNLIHYGFVFCLLILSNSCQRNNTVWSQESQITKKEKEIYFEFLNSEIHQIGAYVNYNQFKTCDISIQKIIYFGDSIFDDYLPKYSEWKKNYSFDYQKMILLSKDKLWLDSLPLNKNRVKITYELEKDLSFCPYLVFTPFYTFDYEKEEFIIGTGNFSLYNIEIGIGKYRRISKGKFELIEEIDGIVLNR